MNETRIDKNFKAYAALVFGILCIGFSPIFVKLANVPGETSAFYRMLIAGAVIIPWWLLRGVKRYEQKDVLLVALGGVFFAIDLVLWNSGLLLTSAATATFLANSAPIWVGLGVVLIFKEKLKFTYWIGLATAFLGMLILIGVEALENAELNIGNVLSLGASFFYALYLLSTQRTRTKIDTLSFMAISLLSSIVILFIYHSVIGTSFVGYSSNAWLSLVGLGLISHMGGWLSINYALGYLRVASVSVSLLSQSIIAAILSLIILSESLSIEQISGGLLILTGVYLVNIVMRKSNSDRE